MKFMKMKTERMKTGNNEPCPQDEVTWEEKNILDIIGTKVIDGEEEGIDTMPALHTPAIDYSTELEQSEVHPINLDNGSYNNEAEQSQSVYSMATCSLDLPADMPLIYHNLDEQHQDQSVNSFFADDNPSNITSGSHSATTSKMTFSKLLEGSHKKMKKANPENELVDIEKEKLQLMKDKLKVKQDLL